MAKLVVIYREPKDPAAFDAYYAATHVPLAQKIPGVKRFDVSTGPVTGPKGNTDVHLVATLYFGSLADLKAGLASPEGQAAAADLANFADGGVELLMFESRAIG